jgi:ribonuclease HI
MLEKNNYNNNQKIIIRGDSQLVINQIKGKYKVRAVKIIPLYQKVKSLLSKFKDIKIEWIPRDKNEEADGLSNKAYQEILENDPNLLQKISQHMATEEQLKLLKSQGITPEKYLSKIEAMRLISKNVSKQ